MNSAHSRPTDAPPSPAATAGVGAEARVGSAIAFWRADFRFESPARWMWGLFALALVPRLLMAFSLCAPCDDAYYYLTLADALAEGDFETAFRFLSINVYPAVLLGLKQFGGDWLTAAKLWGAGIASAAILPLFAWARRAFDDRIAVAACFIYAAQPDLIELSVEPIRDPTFWCLTLTCLCLSHRAVAEGQLRWFALAGLSFALALHTRVEGWFLLVPFVFAIVQRLRGPEAHGRRLATGALLWFAVTPVCLVALNTTLLHEHPTWEWGRFSHFEDAAAWLHSLSRTAPADPSPATATSNLPATAPAGDDARPAAAPTSPAPLPKYWKELVVSIGLESLILLAMGLLLARRSFYDLSKLALPLTAAALLLAVWVRLSYVGNMNGRYFLTALLFVLPTEAVGLLALLNGLNSVFGRFDLHRAMPLVRVASFLAFTLTLSWYDALSTRHVRREAQATLGDSLHHRYGDFQAVLADPSGGSMRIGYAAGHRMPTIIDRVEQLDRLEGPDARALVVFRPEWFPADRRSEVFEHARQRGFVPYDGAIPERAGDAVAVLVRAPGANASFARTAERDTPPSHRSAVR